MRTAARQVVAASSSYPSGLNPEAVGSHYAARRWALNSSTARAHIHLLVLTAGTAVVAAGDVETGLVAPTIAWLPAACADHLDIAAGSTAQLLRLNALVWHRYLAPSAEASYANLMEAEAMLAFSGEPATADALSRSIAAITCELAQPARSGAASIISCELTLCVLRLWRLLGAASEIEADGSAAELLTRFRRLVEERYHEQLRVSAYAQLLGISADRLHAICTRALKRSPSQLIQQRIVQEGVARLEAGGATVKQIAFALGFKDTAYFSRFFRKHTGQPPGKWRRDIASKGKLAGKSQPSLNFADWP